MKITGLEPMLCEGGLVSPLIYVKVTTDEGIIGYGAGTRRGGPVVAEAIKWLAPYVIGENPLNIEKLYFRMRYHADHVGFPTNSITAIETALWDIVGKAMDQPVYNLLGGRIHEKIRLYTHVGGGSQIIPLGIEDGIKASDDSESIMKQCKKIVDKGYTAVKTFMWGKYKGFDWSWSGVFNRQIDREMIVNTVKKVELIRNNWEDIDIAFDVHGMFNITSTIRLARALEPFDLLWYEDPVPHREDMEAIATVKKFVKVPIGTGERLYTTFEFKRLLQMNAVDIVLPDTIWCGGAYQLKKIGDMAQNYLIPIAPHNPLGPLETLIGAHVCATLPNFIALEFLEPDVPWRDKIISEPLKVKDGYLELPEKPGWGVDLVEKEIAKHPHERGTATYYRRTFGAH